MPLKVSNQGWVKVAPPPRPRPKPVDPEEHKENIRDSLRYFACLGMDASRERMRMLGGRAGFSSSQVDLLRPHSRLERSSTLEEWRWDTQPSRSSSRQSGYMFEGTSPPREEATPGKRRNRTSSAPVVIPVSPPASCFSEDVNEANNMDQTTGDYPDHVSVARTETPSERHCRHNHRHHRTRKTPSVIPEEEEASVSATSSVSTPFRYDLPDEMAATISIPAPPPSVARSDTVKSRRPDLDILSPIPEVAATSDLDSGTPPTTIQSEERVTNIQTLPTGREHIPNPTRNPSQSSRYTPSESSESSSRSSHSSRSASTYRSRRSESESSYTASIRSASPVRERDRFDDRRRTRDHCRKDTKHRDDREYDDDKYTESSSYPSPPPSPGPTSSSRRNRNYESSRHNDDYRSSSPPPPAAASSRYSRRDRVVTDPTPSARSRHGASAPRSHVSSTSSYTSSYLSGSSGSSGRSSNDSRSSFNSHSSSSRSSSTAPSINGYQLQAAIFQPKNTGNGNGSYNDTTAHYKTGYRAPSLSRGNRWETATSALSFD